MKRESWVAERVGASGGVRSPAWFAVLCFVLCGAAGFAQEHIVSNSDIGASDGLKTVLEGAANGDVVTVDSSVDAIDLNGVGVLVNGSNVTLQGHADNDYADLVSGFAAGEVADALSSGSAVGIQDRIEAFRDDIADKAPTTNVYNSAASTGTHAGISAPHGGFSVKNMTLSGTVANIDSSTGASKYMGLIGSTFTRQKETTDGQGLGTIENVAFIGNEVHATGAVNLVGNTIFFTQRRYNANGSMASGSDRIEVLDAIRGSAFIGNKLYADMTASVGMRDVGAGGAGWSDITAVESSIFADNYTQGHHAFGGGLFSYSIGTLSDSAFYNNVIESDHDGYGGAVYANGGIDSISGSVFVGNEARGIDFGLGRAAGALGGAISSTGADAYNNPGRAGIGSISDSLFAYNRVYNETGEEANGGAINVSRKFDSVSNTVFYGNSAESLGEAFGGAISVTANAATGVPSTTYTNTQFINNFVASEDAGGGGAIAVNVATNPSLRNPSATPPAAALNLNYEMTLAADAGGVTRFSGNTYNGEANSIYVGIFGEKQDSVMEAGLYTQYKTNYQTNVTMNINAAAGGRVELLDPVKVEILDDGKTFSMNNTSAGEFVWGGANDLNADGGSAVRFANGSNTTLASDFSLASSHSMNIDVDLDGGAKVTMVLSGRDQNTALFKDITSFSNVSGSEIAAEYYGFSDNHESWVIAEGGDAASLSAADFGVSGNTGASVTLSQQGGKLIANLDYHGPDAAFANAGSNAQKVRDAISENWSGNVVPNYNGAQQAEQFEYIVGNLRSFTAEAFMTHGQAMIETSRSISNQARMANSRSRAAYQGGAVASVSSATGLASPVYAGQGSGYVAPGRFRVWAEYAGSVIDQDEKSRYSGYDTHNNGVVFGGSYDFGCSWTLGAYLSYTDSDTDFDDINAKIESDIYQGGVFADYRSATSGWIGSFDMSFAHIENDSKRHALGAYDASYDQSVFGVGLEAGYEFRPWCNGRVTPFAGLRYQHLDQDGVNEKGAGTWGMKVSSADADSFASTLGVNVAHDFVAGCGVITPSVFAAWRHEFADRNVASRARYQGGSIVSSVSSIRQNRDALEIGAAISATIAAGEDYSFGVNGGYNATVNSKRVEHNFYAGIEFRF